MFSTAWLHKSLSVEKAHPAEDTICLSDDTLTILINLSDFNKMQKISNLVSSFLVALSGLTAAGISAATVGALQLVSDNPAVLTTTANADGTFTVNVIGVGTANLVLTANADLVNGEPPISQSFPFTVFDDTTEATHFTMAISGLVEVAQDSAAATGATATASDTSGATGSTAAALDTSGATAVTG